MASLLLWGYRVWPGIWLGAFISNALRAEPAWTAAGIATGNTLAPVLGNFLLQRFGFQNALERVRDVLLLVIFGSAISMTVSATNGVIELALARIVPWNGLSSVWWVWWSGDALGVLIVAPLLLTWTSSARYKPLSYGRILELALLGVTLVAASWVSFLNNLPLRFSVYPFIVWTALRFRQRETATAIVVIAAIAVWGTAHGLGAWGSGQVTDPHGLKIVGDTVYTTDRSDSVAKSFTLDGKVLLELGTRGQHSDTGNVTDWLAERAAGPFNHPTEMIAHPNGDIYVTDGYRNARVHRFTRDGRLVKSWGAPGHGEGQFHLPHSIAFDDDGKLYVADRSNKRIQIFTPEGEFLGQWTGMGGPNDITRGKDGNFYIAEQEDDGKPAQVCVRDGQGKVLARMESRHVHGVGVDSRGDVYAGLTTERSVDKFVRVG